MKVMKNSNNFFSEAIISEWREIATKNNLFWKDSFIKWELPASVEAEFAVVIALHLAKKMNKSPYDAALELKKSASPECNFEIDVTKEGYLNCRIKDNFYKSYLEQASTGHLVREKKESEKLTRVNIEFVSVNPTGYLHLGHLRNAVVGDVIAKAYTFLGYDVTREYYINDRGNQIDELVKSVLFYSNQKNVNVQNISEENLSYKGIAVKSAAQWLLENYSELNDDFTANNVIIKEKIVEFFLQRIKADLLLCGVEFDVWFSEKKMYSQTTKLDLLINKLREKNLVYYQNDALFLRTEGNGDEKDRVLIKNNGEFTYFLSDIIYHIDKMERADLLINIWGSDHHGYVERLRSSLGMIGYDHQERLVVILIQMVSLLENDERKKFSKRAGTAIEIEESLSVINKDQLRFCLLEKEVGHAISINLELLKEQESKSRLYYIEYAHARCNQLIIRAEKLGFNDHNWFVEEVFLLQTNKEKCILKNLIQFDSVIYSVISEKKPFIIIQYLQNLAKEFQTYYQSHQIIDVSNIELTKQRVSLANTVKKVLKKGLSLCGVDAPDLMVHTEV